MYHVHVWYLICNVILLRATHQWVDQWQVTEMAVPGDNTCPVTCHASGTGSVGDLDCAVKILGQLAECTAPLTLDAGPACQFDT